MAIEIVADLNEIQPSSPEWLALRKQGIGGSDAGAVCGLNPHRTPYQVWADKVNPTVPEDREETESQLWGKLLEAPVRDEFSHRTGIEVHTFPRMVRNTDYPFMLANIDGLVGDPTVKLTGVYEGKTTKFPDQWIVNDDGSVNVPFLYVIQGMHYLAVLGLERVYYACLILVGPELRIAEVEVNPNLIADLIEIEEAFWAKVIEREPPEVSAGDVSTLKKRWQPEAGKSIELPASFIPALKVRAQRKHQIDTLKKDMDQIDAEIMALMGDAEIATVANKGVVATWKASSRKEYTVAAWTGRKFNPKEIAE
jgi:putative phage-type endonuclease